MSGWRPLAMSIAWVMMSAPLVDAQVPELESQPQFLTGALPRRDATPYATLSHQPVRTRWPALMVLVRLTPPEWTSPLIDEESVICRHWLDWHGDGEGLSDATPMAHLTAEQQR